MKAIKYLLPEADYMAGLIADMEKYTKKIKKIKNRMRRVWQMPSNMMKIRTYNMLRFRKIYEYHEYINQFLDDGLDNTAYLYIEAFNTDYLRGTFFEEANLLHLAKQLKFPNLDPEDPENTFNLPYYIVDSVEIGFDLNLVRNCMDLFIADDKELAKYQNACLEEVDRRYNSEIFYADDQKKFKENIRYLKMDLFSLFSMKCLPDNITLEQSIDLSIKELEAENNDELKNKKPFVKNVGPYDFSGKKFNPLDNGPQKER
ncbi:MAG: hypothetical protein IJ638_02480 [Alphaproteobacteria bacterium]|nr:hypothetical protein [Alphaproteobacteria bacterium]